MVLAVISETDEVASKYFRTRDGNVAFAENNGVLLLVTGPKPYTSESVAQLMEGLTSTSTEERRRGCGSIFRRPRRRIRRGAK